MIAANERLSKDMSEQVAVRNTTAPSPVSLVVVQHKKDAEQAEVVDLDDEEAEQAKAVLEAEQAKAVLEQEEAKKKKALTLIQQIEAGHKGKEFGVLGKAYGILGGRPKSCEEKAPAHVKKAVEGSSKIEATIGGKLQFIVFVRKN